MSDLWELEADGTVDDVVLDATSVHIEDLGDKTWIGIYRSDGDRFTFEVPGQCTVVEASIGSLVTHELCPTCGSEKAIRGHRHERTVGWGEWSLEGHILSVHDKQHGIQVCKDSFHDTPTCLECGKDYPKTWEEGGRCTNPFHDIKETPDE